MVFRTRKPRGSRIVSKGGLSHQPRIDKTPSKKRRKLEEIARLERRKSNGNAGKKIKKSEVLVGTTDDETELQIPPESELSYANLLDSLKHSGGLLSGIITQRQREERGDSEAEEDSGDEENVEAEETDELGEETEFEESGINEIELEEGESQEEGEETEEELEGETELEDEEEGDEKERGSDEEEEEVRGTDVDAVAAEPSTEGELYKQNNMDSDAHEQPSSHPDTFEGQLGRLISESDVSSLSAAQAGFSFEAGAAGIPRGKWVSNMDNLPQASPNLAEYNLKGRLAEQWKRVHSKPGEQFGDFASERQSQFFALCHSYSDILHTQRQSQSSELPSEVDACLLHVWNHLLKTRDRIVKNNEKLSKAGAAAASQPASKSKSKPSAVDVLPQDDSARDQGFTRPKVLLLLPFRSAALKVVERLIELAPSTQKTTVEHLDRFREEYGVEEEEEEEEGEATEGLPLPTGQKPADHRAMFAGNNDDHFRLGLKLTRKSIKLYSEFYSSDIIVASPIGLVTHLGEAQDSSDKDSDFLSSIEIAVVDMADVILMQNWSHAETVFSSLNSLPSKQHGTDFMRIREWYLNGWAKHFRQTIVLSAYPHASMSALLHRTCANLAGKVKLRCVYDGVLSKVIPQVQQVYERVECSSIEAVEDARFDHFCKKVFPRIRDSMEGGVLLFVRSYFEFVRLRNFLKAQSASFALLGEYTKQSDISRARSWFFHGKRRILLYTERAHFYHRFRIRGIRELVFVSLPDNAHFYSEVLNLLEGIESPQCSVLFSKFDNLQLERIVGSSRSKKMLSSANKTFMFC